MKKSFLKFIAVVMVVVMTAVYVPVMEFDSVFNIEASALTSNNNAMGSSAAKWSYNTSNKTLTISGSGAMPNYTNTPDDFADYNWRLVVTIMNNANKIVINNGITSIGNNVFKGFKNVTSVTIPSSVTSIGNDAFRDMTSLSGITVPASVNTIGARAFQGCTALKSFTIPDAVTKVSDGAFQNCSSLTSINLPKTITSIGANAFSNTKVKTFDIPYSVTSVGSNAFSGISGVKLICNYGDAAYRYCTASSTAYELRKPSLKAEITPTDSDSQIKVSLYLKDASGFNAGNFRVDYNENIAPLSKDYIINDVNGVTTAIVFGSGNSFTIAAATTNVIEYSACSNECTFKIAEIIFRLAPNTHVAKVTFSSSIMMHCDTRYNADTVIAEFGDHNFVKQGDPVAPTCTDHGYTLYKCTICMEMRELDIVAANGHSYDAGVVTAPTCQATGYTTFTCTVCRDSYTDNETAKVEHKYNETITTDPTCSAEGVKTFDCEYCDDKYEQPIDMIAHDYTSVVTEPTCQAGGYTTYTCKACSHSYVGNETAKIDHKYNETITTAPTCSAEGVKTFDCEYCDDTYEQPIAMIAHDYASVVTEPTCQAGGYTTYTCKACSHSYVGNETEKTAHDYASVVTAPTCQAGGYTTHTCTFCATSYKDNETEKVAHSYKAEVTDSTCQVLGNTTYTCEFCADSYKVDHAELAEHDYASVVTAPTCTDKGYTTYTCKECAHSYTDNETATVEHDYKITETVAATCKDEGYETYTCSFCSDSYNETIEKTSKHSFSDVTVVTAPTCTENGFTTYSCEICDYTENRAFVPALGHDYGEDGACTRCDETTVISITFTDNTNITVDDATKTIIIKKTLKAEELKANIASGNWTVTDADGNALADSAAVATGCLIKAESSDTTYTVIILGDVNFDGKVTASDARLVLRVASRLDTGNDLFNLAADCDGKAKISASDARIVLRVASKLQSF